MTVTVIAVFRKQCYSDYNLTFCLASTESNFKSRARMLMCGSRPAAVNVSRGGPESAKYGEYLW